MTRTYTSTKFALKFQCINFPPGSGFKTHETTYIAAPAISHSRQSLAVLAPHMYESPERTWDCAIRSHELVIRYHGLVIRSLELDNSFSRIAICSLELEMCNSRERIAIRMPNIVISGNSKL